MFYSRLLKSEHGTSLITNLCTFIRLSATSSDNCGPVGYATHDARAQLQRSTSGAGAAHVRAGARHVAAGSGA